MTAFLDTNILVCKLVLQALDKRRRATELVNELFAAGEAMSARHAAGQFSFWEALIVEAALAGGAKVLYAEGMPDGQTLDSLTIRNPFLTA